MDVNHVVLLSDERIMRCCLAGDYWAAVAMLRCMRGATIIRSLGTVTALVNTVYSCHSCNYRSWEGTRVNHVISLNNWWAHQPDASEWCSNPVLGWLLIKGALPWWDTVIEMRGRAGKDNGVCEGWDVMVLGLYLNVCGLYCENPWYYWVCEDYNGAVSKVLGDKWINLQILNIQSLEAYQRTHAW